MLSGPRPANSDEPHEIALPHSERMKASISFKHNLFLPSSLLQGAGAPLARHGHHEMLGKELGFRVAFNLAVHLTYNVRLHIYIYLYIIVMVQAESPGHFRVVFRCPCPDPSFWGHSTSHRKRLQPWSQPQNPKSLLSRDVEVHRLGAQSGCAAKA